MGRSRGTKHKVQDVKVKGIKSFDIRCRRHGLVEHGKRNAQEEQRNLKHKNIMKIRECSAKPMHVIFFAFLEV